MSVPAEEPPWRVPNLPQWVDTWDGAEGGGRVALCYPVVQTEA